MHQPFGKGLDATYRAIEHLGYVQIDTISVVERAHHHVLWNRVPNYLPAHANGSSQRRAVVAGRNDVRPQDGQ